MIHETKGLQKACGQRPALGQARPKPAPIPFMGGAVRGPKFRPVLRPAPLKKNYKNKKY